MNRVSLLTSVIACAMLSGCANYDSSQFRYQSGGLPFAGFSFAIGNDEPDAPVVRRGDGTSWIPHARREPDSVLQRISSQAAQLRDALTGIDIGEERTLTP